MRCPSCRSEFICAAECFELRYELTGDGTPADLVNAEDVFAGPGQYYYLCNDCDHRWEREGDPLTLPVPVPERL